MRPEILPNVVYGRVDAGCWMQRMTKRKMIVIGPGGRGIDH